MKMLLLTYPRLDISVQAIVTPAKSEADIRKDWKHKYGQLLERCIIEKITDELPEVVVIKPLIKHIESGREFMSVKAASICLGISKYKIRHHLNRKLKIRIKYEFEYIEQTA